MSFLLTHSSGCLLFNKLATRFFFAVKTIRTAFRRYVTVQSWRREVVQHRDEFWTPCPNPLLGRSRRIHKGDSSKRHTLNRSKRGDLTNSRTKWIVKNIQTIIHCRRSSLSVVWASTVMLLLTKLPKNPRSPHFAEILWFDTKFRFC